VGTVKRLLLSVHDAAPGHEGALREMHGILRDCGIGSRYCLLVVPDFWDSEPLSEHPDFTSWLRELSAEGVEIALHGYSHLAPGNRGERGIRSGRGLLTDGEDEFRGLSREDAARRILRGLGVLREQVLVRESLPGFVAPAWLSGRGTLEALADMGIPWTENHRRILFPGRGTSISSPVVCFATRSPARRVLSVLWSIISPLLLALHSTVRIALHPSDLTSGTLARRLPSLVRKFTSGREVCLYSDLVSEQRSPGRGEP
jgi:predicted deacetylase